MFGGNATDAIIDDLVTETEYSISVAGLTIDEELEKVGPVLVTTCKCSFNIFLSKLKDSSNILETITSNNIST